MDKKIVMRGYVETDSRDFSPQSIITLKKAQEEIKWLLDRGYPIKSVVTFVGNHYMISERQRLALMRATSSTEFIVKRKNKEILNYENQVVYIDGFNLIITLEVALSDSTLIKCMDGTIRDLAGLRGTYRLIDKTDIAIALIGAKLQSSNISEAVFYLDSPVSNTGRLKTRILELLMGFNYKTSIELVNNADVLLQNKPNVVTTDAIILNSCISWINLSWAIILESICNAKYIDLG